MHINIRHAPSFAVVKCSRGSHEQFDVEAGAMVAHSEGAGLEASLRGGLGKSLKRGILGGEYVRVVVHGTCRRRMGRRSRETAWRYQGGDCRRVARLC